jgi:hypothetical protein
MVRAGLGARWIRRAVRCTEQWNFSAPCRYWIAAAATPQRGAGPDVPLARVRWAGTACRLDAGWAVLAVVKLSRAGGSFWS